jgi:hypothetical protein
MNDMLLQFCHWLQNREWALALGGSTWAFPYSQLIHYTGMSIWVGTSLLVDFCFLGWFKRRQTPAEFASDMFALNWTGLGIGLVGAILLFSGSAETYFQNAAFRIKIPIALFGLCYHIFLQMKNKEWGKTAVVPGIAKMAAFFEIVIWFGVVLAATRIPNQ